MTAPLNPKQFGPYISAVQATSQNRIRSLFGGGHSNPGYGNYDHLSTEPISLEQAVKVAHYRGADGKN